MESIRFVEIYSSGGGVFSTDDHLGLKKFRLEAYILTLCYHSNSVHCSWLRPVDRHWRRIYVPLCSPRCGSIPAFEIILYPSAQHL